VEVFPRKRIADRALLIAASCFLLSIPFVWAGKDIALFLGIIWGGGLIWFGFFVRRYFIRRRIAERGISPAVRETLEKMVSFYGRLNDEEKVRYENSIAIFLGENRITGVSGVEITDEVRALVAATAVRLTFNRPGHEYHDFGEILIYPSGFSADGSYSTAGGANFSAAGMVHSQGGVILSLPHLLRSFQHDNDGFNVGYHEFAHVLDGRRPDGIPEELDLGSYRPWAEVMQKEFERVHRRKSVLRDYAGTNPAEFFACAVEFFFEKPETMKERAPEVYRQLARYFNQDPASDRQHPLPG
jgi:MtfA peptidase